VKTVYETTNSADAHVVLGLLQQFGIESHVLGENLGMWANPLGSVRVVVEPVSEEAALEVIAEWEAGQPRDRQRPSPQLRRGALLVVVVAAILLAVFWYFTGI
jgi:Putative prokaryotic signal transducing protein